MKNILPELDGKTYIENLADDYEIRLCKEEEYEELVNFLRLYWKEDHIFVLSKEMLDFQHLDTYNHHYNFVIAKEKKSNEIHSLLGFVPTSQYDKEIKKALIWPCIWKSRDDINRKGLGVALYYYLKTHIEIETIAILGISEVALSIYKHWNFSTGKIDQYVMPNYDKKSKLASGLDQCKRTTEDDTEGFVLKQLSIDDFFQISEEEDLFVQMEGYKTKNYYINRFYRHPFYHYHVLGIEDSDHLAAVIVARVSEHESNKCLRIVDYIGQVDAMIHVKNKLQKILTDNDLEYMDFVAVGLDDNVLKNAGFFNRKDYPGMIVPNYFEPFVQKNIDLDYAFKSVDNIQKMIFYKADADQDRPNICRKKENDVLFLEKTNL